MQYKPETEKVAMMGTHGTFIPKPLLPADDPQIRRTRKILLIILGIFFTLAVINLSPVVLGHNTENPTVNTLRGPYIGQALTSICFYGFGLFVAYHYFATGLRVFAWLNIIMLVLSIIGLGGFLALTIVGTSILYSASDDGELVIVISNLLSNFPVLCIIIIVIFTIIILIILMIIIKLCFKLARLIDANRRLAIQQI